MQQLEQKLTRQLLQNNKVKLLNKSQWCIPCQSLEVAYTPVKRVTMDVLMKMLLLTFQQMPTSDCEEIAQLLHVELLFIEDLVKDLLVARLIDRETQGYNLTEKGHQQLQEGIFEQQQPLDKQTLLYSVVHQKFLAIQLEDIEEYDELPALYRHVSEQVEEVTWDETQLTEAINHIRSVPDDPKVQTIITNIADVKKIQIVDLPCIEFVLYNTETDVLYVRVWNTILRQWDEILEQHITERDIVSLRTSYLKDM